MKFNSRWLLAAALTILPAVVLSLAAQQSNSLIIAGQQGTANVIQAGGRNYVDVDGLARLTNGSIGFNGNQIVLTLPGGNAGSSVSASAAPAAGFSKGFVTAGIEAMTVIREWRTSLKSALEHSYRLNASWHETHRAQSQQNLLLASLSVNTDSDRSALPFLTNEFNNMTALSSKYLQTSLSLLYIAPNALDGDPLDQKIRACARSLASMATANQFVDDGSCQ